MFDFFNEFSIFLWKSMEIYKNLRQLMKIKWKIGNPRTIQENQPLIKHLIKELMREIGRSFSGNLRKSKKS